MLSNIFSLRGLLKITLFSAVTLFVTTCIVKPGYEAYKINNLLTDLSKQRFDTPSEARSVLVEKMAIRFS